MSDEDRHFDRLKRKRLIPHGDLLVGWMQGSLSVPFLPD